MSERRLVLRAYRCLLQWARANAAVPFSVRRGDVLQLAPGQLPASLQDASAVYNVARQAFKAGKNMKARARACWGEEASEGVDRALAALRLLHDDYGESIARMRATRDDRADRTGVLWGVGTVFAHAGLGYRGVVYGWDRACERGAEWADAMGVDPAQPFYHVLPDEGDCVRLFGGVRISKYVAQDNVQPLRSARVTHRALDVYFDGRDAASGRYIPSRKLQYEYPDAYDAKDIQPIGDDSNLLAHDDWPTPTVEAKRHV